MASHPAKPRLAGINALHADPNEAAPSDRVKGVATPLRVATGAGGSRDARPTT